MNTEASLCREENGGAEVDSVNCEYVKVVKADEEFLGDEFEESIAATGNEDDADSNINEAVAIDAPTTTLASIAAAAAAAASDGADGTLDGEVDPFYDKDNTKNKSKIARKALSVSERETIYKDLLAGGVNEKGNLPHGRITQVALKYDVSAKSVSRIWERGYKKKIPLIDYRANKVGKSKYNRDELKMRLEFANKEDKGRHFRSTRDSARLLGIPLSTCHRYLQSWREEKKFEQQRESQQQMKRKTQGRVSSDDDNENEKDNIDNTEASSHRYAKAYSNITNKFCLVNNKAPPTVMDGVTATINVREKERDDPTVGIVPPLVTRKSGPKMRRFSFSDDVDVYNDSSDTYSNNEDGNKDRDVAKKQKVSKNLKLLQEHGESKFCIFCGVKLPVVARFCSRCGGEQVTPSTLKRRSKKTQRDNIC